MRATNRIVIVSLLLVAGVATDARAQQGPDTAWVPNVARPAYAGGGPRVGIDEAHHNFHTASGNYRPFATLLARDGYRVAASTQPFTRASLFAFDVLVIANARGGATLETVAEPAFTAAERAALRDWVRGGGSLLLVADHFPFGAATEALSLEFGVGMSKGYTFDSTATARDQNPSFLRFTRENGLLGRHAIMDGRDAAERVSIVQTFTGQSLTVPAGAAALLRLSPTARDREPPTREELQAQAAARQRMVDSLRAALRAGGGRDSTLVRAAPMQLTGPQRFTSAAGRAQGVALAFGAGRVVVLGEAAMLSAQVVDLPGQPTIHMGMNIPGTDDQQFALNVMHWLSRLY
ncbi:hypothetical protein [Longimicrobium sp.]|uniref:hypothetical protein n=1 Tax=Longimicrobium sp. TaxID=2029185 RepID=UPI002C6450BF|nr:hypothetical protein [Longimicrobium sp.]HSU16536.1 hypothetical protein [Longimicrobium sp.]